jgi:hypothetical protein
MPFGHIGWLSWISDEYFARFRDVDARATLHERLVAQLGGENLDVAPERCILMRPHQSIERH